MFNIRTCGYRMLTVLPLVLSLVAALVIDVQPARSQTREAEALYAQHERLFKQGRFSEAIPLAQRILGIREKVLGPNRIEVGVALNDLASDYLAQGRYSDAEPLYKRSLAIYEKSFGTEHREIATSLNNLALLYIYQGRYSDAEPL